MLTDYIRKYSELFLTHWGKTVSVTMDRTPVKLKADTARRRTEAVLQAERDYLTPYHLDFFLVPVRKTVTVAPAETDNRM
jgi:hypothetical protein